MGLAPVHSTSARSRKLHRLQMRMQGGERSGCLPQWLALQTRPNGSTRSKPTRPQVPTRLQGRENAGSTTTRCAAHPRDSPPRVSIWRRPQGSSDASTSEGHQTKPCPANATWCRPKKPGGWPQRAKRHRCGYTATLHEERGGRGQERSTPGRGARRFRDGGSRPLCRRVVFAKGFEARWRRSPTTSKAQGEVQGKCPDVRCSVASFSPSEGTSEKGALACS